MKVSYIILPFEDPTYLVRCVNSMYRQLGEDFEVILAENDFGERQEEIEEFLESKPQVLRIPKLEIPASIEVEEKEEESEEKSETENFEENDIPQDEEENQEEMAKPTPSEKLAQALSLISDDSDYVMLIDVNTVVSPICAKAVLKCENYDLIIPAAAVKKGDGFVSDCPEISSLQKNFDKYIPQRFCFSKELFGEFKAEFIENNELFSIFLLTVLVKGIEVISIEDIVIYVQSFAAPKMSESTNFETIKEQCDEVFAKLYEIEDIDARVTVFEKLIKRILPVLNDKKFDEIKTDNENEKTEEESEKIQRMFDEIQHDFNLLFDIYDTEARTSLFNRMTKKISDLLGEKNAEIRKKAFEILQGYYRDVREDFLLKSILESSTGFQTEDFLTLGYDEFILYKSHVKGAGNPVTAIDCATQNKLLKDIKAVLDANKKALEVAQNGLTDVKKDVAAIKAKPFTVAMPAVAAGTVISDPYIDIPKMYREGRLGLKTIWRSFWSWFKFKFSRKK